MAIQIQGLDELLKQFGNLENMETGDALLGGAYILQEESMRNAPVKTGFMRNSHQSTKTGKDEVEMAVTAEYAYYVEQKKPYVRPAIDSKEKEIVTYVNKYLVEQIKREV